jgi:hypothetical protein
MPIDLPGPIWFVVIELPMTGSPSNAAARIGIGQGSEGSFG